MTVTTFVKLQMCLGPHYIESYQKGTVDGLYRGGIICLKLTIY